MSELFGRRLPYLISWPLLVGESYNFSFSSRGAYFPSACIAPSAWANNFAVILVCTLIFWDCMARSLA